MTEFWEESFKDKHTMWGFEHVDSVNYTLNLFKKHGLNKMLIPGFGYGRNAVPFLNNGFDVTGIEISETAIELAKSHFGDNLKVYHGSVCDMPFNQELYEAIYCYALIHLLSENERAKFINACYHQLTLGGYMVFVAVSTNDTMFGQGLEISKNRYKTRHGINLFFYDLEAIEKEFGSLGFIDAIEITEPAKIIDNKPYLKLWQIICKKP